MNTLPPIDVHKETNRITEFIKQTFAKAGKKHALVALSGGIDSATTLSLTLKALSPDQVYALHLPSKHTLPQHTVRVKQLVTSLQIPPNHFITINIGSIVQKTWRSIKHHTDQEKAPAPGSTHRVPAVRKLAQINRPRLANITARTRMTVLFDQAKKLDGLVVGTENYSEHLLGYYTRFGDEASDLEPIRHLYKTQVIEVAKHLKLPHDIITKAPSADLWPGQSDEKELGFRYLQADPILYRLDQGDSTEKIIQAGFDSDLVKAVFNRVKQNSFKHLVPYQLDTFHD